MIEERKAWQCHLSDRDWAIVAASWDNALNLEEGIKSFKAFEKEAEAGHFGNCTGDAETCFKCSVESYYKLGCEMRDAHDKEYPCADEYKYLEPKKGTP